MTTIYGLQDPITKELRYVGMTDETKEHRLYMHIQETNHNSQRYVHRWMRKLKREHNVDPDVFEIDVADYAEGGYWEIFYITYYRSIGCRLTNGTLGGDGRTSQSWTVKQREEAKQRKLIWNKKHPEEVRKIGEIGTISSRLPKIREINKMKAIKRNEDPEKRKQFGLLSSKYWNTPENNERQSKTRKEYFTKEENRELARQKNLKWCDEHPNEVRRLAEIGRKTYFTKGTSLLPPEE